MEYLYYLLVILALVALCLYLVRIPGQERLRREAVALADRARKRRRQAAKAAEEAPAPPPPHVMRRELKHVPTPWGWPGSEIRQSGSGHPGSSGSLQGWVDRLLSEKRTVDDSEYLLHKDACLRALLEDRFGRPSQASEVPYRKVSPPRLRDPGRPYDQEDNFPSGRTESIVARLSRQPGKRVLAYGDRAVPKSAALKDVKTPWGW